MAIIIPYEEKQFESYNKNMIASQEEREAIEEIQDIKSKVLIKDRHLFFK